MSISFWPAETTPPTVKTCSPTTCPVAGARTCECWSCSRVATSLGSVSDSLLCVSLRSVSICSSRSPANAQRLHPGFANALARPGIFGDHLRFLALELRLRPLELRGPG